MWYSKVAKKSRITTSDIVITGATETVPVK